MHTYTNALAHLSVEGLVEIPLQLRDRPPRQVECAIQLHVEFRPISVFEVRDEATNGCKRNHVAARYQQPEYIQSRHHRSEPNKYIQHVALSI